MKHMEWQVSEDGYEEQITLSKEVMELAEQEGISTENGKKITVLITNLSSGEIYINRLAITGNRAIYVPVEIQKMLKGSGKIRIQLLGG